MLIGIYFIGIRAKVHRAVFYEILGKEMVRIRTEFGEMTRLLQVGGGQNENFINTKKRVITTDYLNILEQV